METGLDLSPVCTSWQAGSEAVMGFVNELFTLLDELVERYGVFKARWEGPLTVKQWG